MKNAQWYLRQIQDAQERTEKWRAECAEAEKTYASALRFNVLFSNTQLLLAALVNNNPKPVIRVRFPKENAQSAPERQLARTVGEVSERAVLFNNEETHFHNALRDLALCALLHGRGVFWLSYETNLDTEESGTQITRQAVRVQNLGYKDLLCSYARSWEQTAWVARRHIMTQHDLNEKFGTATAAQIPLTYKEDTKNPSAQKGAADAAVVWEIWDKEEKNVIFVSENYPEILQRLDDPLGLPGFFPCPKPLQFIETPSMDPVPEYRLYKKTAKEVDRICGRINALMQAVKAVACAPASVSKELSQLAEEDDGAVVSVDVPEIGANGGLENIISEYPNASKIQVLSALEQRKHTALQEIYDITGIADILRGQGSAEETATQSRIKGVFGSLRLKSRQRALQVFVRDTFKMITDIICENFTEEILRPLTCIELPTQQQKAQAIIAQENCKQQGQPLPAEVSQTLEKPSWTEVIATLREDKLRSYTIEVESTATAFEEGENEKQERLDLFKQTVSTLQAALPLMAAQPELAGMFKNLLNFTVDAFGQSRVLKESVEAALSALEQKFTAPKPSAGPSPEQMLAQAEMMKAQVEIKKAQLREFEMQLEAQKTAAELGQSASKNAEDANIKTLQILQQAKASQADLQLKASKQQQDAEKAAAELMLKARGKTAI